MARNKRIAAQKAARQAEQQMAPNTINFREAQRVRHIELVPKSLNQENYILKLLDPKQHIVIAYGPAGTGKTYIAMQAAIKQLKMGAIERIVLTRPAVGVEDEKHGFLPGDLNSKMEPWTRPIFDFLEEYYNPKQVLKMVEDKTIEISPLAYMRGRTFKRAWIIADEMQNATQEQTKMLLTRIGEGSKIVVTGDLAQHDRGFTNNGLKDFLNKFDTAKCQSISHVQFEKHLM